MQGARYSSRWAARNTYSDVSVDIDHRKAGSVPPTLAVCMSLANAQRERRATGRTWRVQELERRERADP